MLNKRECRRFADPDLKMKKGSGLLHAGQIDYIIRTAVKIIGHHKTLVLYAYSRTQAEQGSFQPCYTVFQSREDFITLAQKENGGTAWRTAAFDNLGYSWDFQDKCAFYSAADETRLCRYFKNSPGSGFKPLLKAQAGIQERRRQERQRIREQEIVRRMECVPALPRGLKSWIHKSVMPAYFFYDYKRGGKDVPGVCSACGHEIRLSNVKMGDKGICPHCMHELVMKPRSRRGYCMTDRDTCQVIQNTGSGGLVIRIIKARYTYMGDTPQIQIYENARQFVRQDESGKVCLECYYYQRNSGTLTNWKKGERCGYGLWQYSFEADTCGHVFDKNLPAALKNTLWQYCPIADFYNHDREPMQALPFLAAYLEHPRLEHLVKTGFYHIVSDMVYRHASDCLDETQDRTHRILRIAAEDTEFLRKLDANVDMLKAFQGYAGLKDRQRLFLWQLKHKVKQNIPPILKHMTVHKFIRYIESQYAFLRLRKTPHGPLRYKEIQDLVTEYRDYLDMCRRMGYDMKNSFVQYPKDLQKSHDKTARRYEQKKDTLTKRDFAAVYQQLSGRLDFEKDGLKIVYPDTPDDIVAEGNALHHCVGSYVERVAEEECIILFLRRCADECKPFYTIEVRGQEVVQVRGAGNCSMTPEVEAFITDWEQSVLSARLPAAAA